MFESFSYLGNTNMDAEGTLRVSKVNGEAYAQQCDTYCYQYDTYLILPVE